ncbi:MAG: carboxypeptidase-like regulatory domain-containing protein [Thermoplasmatota archaeon]
MRRSSALLVAMSALLAGCGEAPGAAPPAADEAAALAEADDAARSVDVAATDTTGVIRGVVVDGALRPVAGASVRLNAGAEVETGATGAFGFAGLDAGTYFLTAEKPGYATAQVAVDVVAGRDEPEPVRILLEAVPDQAPFIEALSARLVVDLAASVDGVVAVSLSGLGVFGEGGQSFSLEVAPNGTVAQSEFVWEPVSPMAESGHVAGGTVVGGDWLDVSGAWRGMSPIVAVAQATVGNETADQVAYTFWPSASSGTPVGMQAGQAVDAFVHIFHNFRPDEGWTFTADGPHPVPG